MDFNTVHTEVGDLQKQLIPFVLAFTSCQGTQILLSLGRACEGFPFPCTSFAAAPQPWSRLSLPVIPHPPASVCMFFLILIHPTDAACKCTKWFKSVLSVCKCTILRLLRGTSNICSLRSDITQNSKQGGYLQQRHAWACCAALPFLLPHSTHPEPALCESGFTSLTERFLFLDVCVGGGDTRSRMQILCALSRKALCLSQNFSYSEVYYSRGLCENSITCLALNCVCRDLLSVGWWCWRESLAAALGPRLMMDKGAGEQGGIREPFSAPFHMFS